MGQAPPHQPHHRHVDERFARRAEPHVTPAQAAALPAPAEGACHRPAAGRDTPNPLRPKGRPVDDGTQGRPDAARFRRRPDDLHPPPPPRLDPGVPAPRVPLLHPDMLPPGDLLHGAVQHLGTAARPWMAVLCPVARRTSPGVSPSRWRLRPLSRFAPSEPRPPTPVVWTDWLPSMPAPGWGSRPAWMRTASRRA